MSAYPSSGKAKLTCLLVLIVASCPALVLGDAVEADRILTAEGSRNDSPAICFDAQGQLWVAWASFKDGRYRLAVASRAPDGKISPIEYPDSSATDQVDPVWAVGPEGTPCVVYAAHDGKQWTIRKAAVPAETVRQVPEVIGRGTRPTAAVAEGELWVAWEQDPNLLILRPDGTKVVRTPQGDITRLAGPVLAAGADGAVWLAWEAARPGYQSIRLQRIDRRDLAPMVVDEGEDVNRHPSVSVDGEGRVWIVCEQLRHDDLLKGVTPRSVREPFYALDRVYRVRRPSRAVLVTDGRQWWTPETSREAALGLAPSLFCSRAGTVWLVSWRFGDFFPVCESLGADGWENHHGVWGQRRSYKASLPMAESPDGKVWTAWAQHERRWVPQGEAPAWTLADGPDVIVVAPMPEAKSPGRPRLVAKPKSMPEPPAPVAITKYEAEYQGEKLNVYFGDMHVHSEFSACGRYNGAIEEDVAYSRDVRGLDFYAPGDHAEHLNDHNWHATRMAIRRHDRPGVFVPYMGFEWTSEFDRGNNLYRGHYNPIFRQIGKGEQYFSASDLRTNTPLKLWTALRNAAGGPENVLTFGHHTSRRGAWLSWNYYDPEMAPLIEIAQTRGSYEYAGCPRGLVLSADCNRVQGHFIQDGLARGMRFGIAANGDHGGRQLTAVFAPELQRNSIFESMRAKRTYGTSGERMFLDVRVNGRFMGEEFRLDADQPRTISINAQGTSLLTQIDVFRNGRIIQLWNVCQQEFNSQFVDRDPLFERENYYYVRLTQKDGNLAWSSPTWVINRSVPGEFKFQVGGDELHVVYPQREADFSILMHNQTDQPVEGAVTLDVPGGWKIKEGPTINVQCRAGGWEHAVFSVTPPKSAFAALCLPKLVARFKQADGAEQASKLLVVGSPYRISPENKAKLIDAKFELTPRQFEQYVEKMEDAWRPQ